MNGHPVSETSGTGQPGGARAADRSPDELDFRVTTAEAELVLEALGAMRYSTVYRLIAKLQAQARQQVEAEQAAADSGGSVDAPVDLRDVSGPVGARRA